MGKTTDYAYRDAQRELFFKNLKLLAVGRQIGLKLFEAFGVFRPKYQDYFGTVSPLSTGKCIWFFSLQKTLVSRSKTYNSQIWYLGKSLHTSVFCGQTKYKIWASVHSSVPTKCWLIYKKMPKFPILLFCFGTIHLGRRHFLGEERGQKLVKFADVFNHNIILFHSTQKYSRLRCLLCVKGLVICFYLGWSGSILQFRQNMIKVGSKSCLLTVAIR